MRVHKPKRRQRRSDRRFRLGPWSDGRELEPGLELEARVLLSARAAAMTNARHAHATVRRVTPAAEINAQYNAFASDFAAVEQLMRNSEWRVVRTSLPVHHVAAINVDGA